MSVEPSDFIDRSRVSNCCGAPILAPDFCSECREHCEAVDENEDPEPNYDAPKPLTPMENFLRNDEHNVK